MITINNNINKKRINCLIYFLFLIPIIFSLCQNVIFDNDIWFLLNSGRYVLENGIPTIEPFTIHTNMSFIMPQWLSALIFWIIYNKLGKIFLYLFIVTIGICIFIVFYKLCKEISNNKFISLISCILLGILIKEHIVSRPQIFTYLILLIELFILEKYVSTNNKKYLIALPILSIIQINLHASMWYLMFLFLLPYLINGIKIKKFNIKLGNYNLKPLLLIIALMIIVGFINPYGYKAITYLLNSYFIPEINKFIMEMNPISFSNYNGKIFTFLIFIIIFIINFNGKNKLNLRFYLLLTGTALLTFMHNKGWPYFIITYFLCLVSLLKDINIKNILLKLKSKYITAILKGIYISVISITLFIFGYTTITCSKKVFNSKEDNLIKNTVDYMEKNYNLDKIILYIDYNNGGYTEYRGIKSYIDPRAEVFLKANNNKKDIFLEFYDMKNNNAFDYQAFTENYKFTHILVYCNDDFDQYLTTNENYIKIFTQKYDDIDIMNLYVKK